MPRIQIRTLALAGALALVVTFCIGWFVATAARSRSEDRRPVAGDSAPHAVPANRTRAPRSTSSIDPLPTGIDAPAEPIVAARLWSVRVLDEDTGAEVDDVVITPVFREGAANSLVRDARSGPPYAIRMPVDGGPLDVEVTASRYRTLQTRLDPDSSVVDLTLQRAARVFGRITSELGDPVPGAIVRVGPHAVLSDETGRYEVLGVDPAERHIFAVTRDGVRHVRGAPVAFERGARELEVNHRIHEGLEITFEVTDASRTPISTATVRVESWNGRLDSQTAATSAEGIAVVAGLRSGAHRVLVTAPGFSPTVIREVRPEGRVVRCVLEEQRPLRITGRVLGPDGRPIEGAQVRTVNARGTVAATTDERGRFELRDVVRRAPPTSPLHAQAGAELKAQFSRSGLASATFELVVDSDGEYRMAAPAVVAVSLRDAEDPSHRFEEIGAVFVTASGGVCSGRLRRSTKYGPNGFEIRLLPATAGTLLVRVEDGRSASLSLDLGSADRPDVATLILAKGGVVSASVRNANGEPWELFGRLVVESVELSESAGQSSRVGLSRGQARTAPVLGEGRYRVRVDAPGHVCLETREVDVVVGREARVELRVAEHASMHVQVSRNRRTVSAGDIRIRYLAPWPDAFATWARNLDASGHGSTAEVTPLDVAVRLDSEGSWTARGLPPGIYQVSVDGATSEQVSEIRLEPGESRAVILDVQD